MLSYLEVLAKAYSRGNIELLVFFNGMLEKMQLQEWVKWQGNECQMVQQIISCHPRSGSCCPSAWPTASAWCSSASMSRSHRALRITIRR